MPSTLVEEVLIRPHFSLDELPKPASPVTAVRNDHLYSRDGVIGPDGLTGSPHYCSFVYRIDQVEGSKVERTWVPCGRWVCRWCREQKIESEARRFAAGFAADGRPVRVSFFGTREQATNAMRYSTKLGHAALAVPMTGGGAVVFTTQPRRDGKLVPGADSIRVELELFLSQVPAYTKDGGEHRVVNPNRVLGELLLSETEFRQQEIHDRRSQYMDPDALAGVERREASRVRLYGTEQLDTVLEQLDLVLTRSQHGHIMSYRIPDWSVEPLVAMLFETEFEKLQQVGRVAA